MERNRMMVRSVPELLALCKGTPCVGDLQCFYCAAPCDGSYPITTYVKSSFNARMGVRCPGSPAVCHGCVIAMDERADIQLLDGEAREAQKTRMYSWVITSTSAIAATKAHLHLLRPIFLNPPIPPFALVLTDSGQKQLIYRGKVNHDQREVVCTLEEQVIAYRPSVLQERLHLVGRLVAATGKPALAEPINARFGMSVLERYPETGEELLNQWEKLREEGVSRLALWISANKEDCGNQYPAEHRLSGIPATDSRTTGPRDATSGKRERRDEGARKQASLFAS